MAILCRIVLLILFALMMPALALAQGGETRIASPRNLESARAEAFEVFGRSGALDELSPTVTLLEALFAAQSSCSRAKFDNAKLQLLNSLDSNIEGARQAADAEPLSTRWDVRRLKFEKFRAYVASFEYSECQERPDIRQAIDLGHLYRAAGAKPVRCPSPGCPPVDPNNVIGTYDWSAWPKLGREIEKLWVYQRICDEEGFNRQKSYILNDWLNTVGHSDETLTLIPRIAPVRAALEKIEYVPCKKRPKPRVAAADAQASGAPADGAAAGNAPGIDSAQGAGSSQGSGQGTGNDQGAGTGSDSAPPPIEDPLPGLDDDRVGLLELWMHPELSATVSFTTSFDGPGASYGQFVNTNQQVFNVPNQFVNTNQPVFNVPDNPDPVCGSGEWTNVFGVPVPVGANLGSIFNPGQARVSLSGQICDGDDDRTFRNFQSNQNFLLGQPNGGTQIINGNMVFDTVALSQEYDSAEAAIGLGTPLLHNGGLLITGELTGEFRYLEIKDQARFTANNLNFPNNINLPNDINFQSTSTQEVESWSGGIGYTAGIHFSPTGPTVPLTGLQTIFVTGSAGLYLTAADGTDTFHTFQIGNFAETQRLNLSETEWTTAFGATAGVRIGLGHGAAFTVEGFWNAIETPFVRTRVGQVSTLDLEHIDQTGVRGRLSIWISDIRLKRDISLVATLENGIRIYSFRYLRDDAVHVGVMAQDLLAHRVFRHAVIRMPNGFYAVDYAMLGLKMTTLGEWSEQTPRARP